MSSDSDWGVVGGKAGAKNAAYPAPQIMGVPIENRISGLINAKNVRGKGAALQVKLKADGLA